MVHYLLTVFYFLNSNYKNFADQELSFM